MGYKEAGYVAQQLSELGLSDIKLIGNYVYDTEDLLALAGDELEGCIFATDGDLSDPRFDEIRAEYQEYQDATGMALHMPGLRRSTKRRFWNMRCLRVVLPMRMKCARHWMRPKALT